MRHHRVVDQQVQGFAGDAVELYNAALRQSHQIANLAQYAGTLTAATVGLAALGRPELAATVTDTALLPGLLNGLGLQANVTLQKAKANVFVNGQMREQRMTQAPEVMYNAALFYSHGGFAAEWNYNYTGDRLYDLRSSRPDTYIQPTTISNLIVNYVLPSGLTAVLRRVPPESWLLAAIAAALRSLFAERGFAETSLRNITSKAKVNLAAVNYHFGSKKSLIQAVFARYLDPFTERFHAALDELDERPVRGRERRTGSLVGRHARRISGAPW